MDAGGGRRRVVIEGVRPQIDCGRFAAKCEVGDDFVVEADVFADGHDEVACRLLWRHGGAREWCHAPMRPLGNDRWRGSFRAERLGRHRFTVAGWIDAFGSWRRDLRKRLGAGQDVAVDLLIGAALIERAAGRARGDDRHELANAAAALRGPLPSERKAQHALDPRLATVMPRYPDLEHMTIYDRQLTVVADPVRARFSAWYELFPRSTGAVPGRHGTFRDVEAWLDYVAGMGFDVLYLAPIHPIGETNRKGPNNRVDAGPGDPGSPWAIGSDAGGHMAVHPELGTVQELRGLIARARERDIEIALDIAFQSSPDHPWVRERPEWFRARPDGTIQYAENPPKKYQDIYPIEFDNPEWRSLWLELERVIQHWIDQGVRTFRVDNPHTKLFAFWEWVIDRLKAKQPDVVFLSEAFTRPRIMYRLAKLGFTQSYTYFTWRNSKAELEQYLTELTATDVASYFRPNFWPNTPDILHDYLQTGGRPAFMARLVLAATLVASYGIYGPAFELLEHRPRDPGSEEYVDSEKYQLRHWELDRPDSLRDFITRVNHIRRDNLALQSNRSLRFHRIDNDAIIAYSKRHPEERVVDDHGSSRDDDGSAPNIILVVVNLDPRNTQSGWVELPLNDLGIDEHRPFEVHDLLGGERYRWHGAWNYVELDPAVVPAHIFSVSQPPT